MTLNSDPVHAWVKDEYGVQYPAIAIVGGLPLPLVSETRWLRKYENEQAGLWVSRFLDGSAEITLTELEAGWSQWNEQERSDFCFASGWLTDHPDIPGILRFILKNGNSWNCSNIALSVASQLPQEEAFTELLRCLKKSAPGPAVNFSQAIARTKHPQAEATLRWFLRQLWSLPALWEDDGVFNWLAFDAVACIEHLITLGVSPAEFETEARALAAHPCAGTRESWQTILAKYYPALAGNKSSRP